MSWINIARKNEKLREARLAEEKKREEEFEDGYEPWKKGLPKGYREIVKLIVFDTVNIMQEKPTKAKYKFVECKDNNRICIRMKYGYGAIKCKSYNEYKYFRRFIKEELSVAIPVYTVIGVYADNDTLSRRRILNEPYGDLEIVFEAKADAAIEDLKKLYPANPLTEEEMKAAYPLRPGMSQDELRAACEKGVDGPFEITGSQGKTAYDIKMEYKRNQNLFLSQPCAA